MKEAQLDSHAKAQSLVDGDLDAPTVGVVHVLMFDDLLDVVEVREDETRMAAHVVGTEARVPVVVLGRCARWREVVERRLGMSAMLRAEEEEEEAAAGPLTGDVSGRVVPRSS